MFLRDKESRDSRLHNAKFYRSPLLASAYSQQQPKTSRRVVYSGGTGDPDS